MIAKLDRLVWYLYLNYPKKTDMLAQFNFGGFSIKVIFYSHRATFREKEYAPYMSICFPLIVTHFKIWLQTFVFDDTNTNILKSQLAIVQFFKLEAAATERSKIICCFKHCCVNSLNGIYAFALSSKITAIER